MFLFNRKAKRRIVSIFRETYKDCLHFTTREELIPLMVAISDLALFEHGKNQKEHMDQLLTWLSIHHKDVFESPEYVKRARLYGKAATGQISIRADWYLGEDPIDDSPFINCMAMFGDFTLSSSYVDNYENAPSVILPLPNIMDANFSTIQPVFVKMVDYYKKISEVA